MFESINEVAVIGCTLFMLALYTLWYAAWGKGRTIARSEMSELLTVGAALLVWVSVCALVNSFVIPLGTPPQIVASVLTLAMVFSTVPAFAKEGKTMKEMLVHVGYVVVLCVGTVYILNYWPW